MPVVKDNRNIRILSWNIQGKESHEENKKINKLQVLVEHMKKEKYDIACIQETKAEQGLRSTAS